MKIALEATHKMFASINNLLLPVTSKTCLYHTLKEPTHVAIKRSVHDNLTTISPSQTNKFKYTFINGTEILDGVPLRHDFIDCPGKNQTVPGDYIPRFCICILITNKTQFLTTQRSLNISFPGAWVFPGGGIEQGQTIIEAAKRQVKEQVGLQVQINPESSRPMLWQSFYVVNNNIKRSNLVLFLESTGEPKGDVKMQQSQVMGYRWRQLQKIEEDQIVYSSECKVGFAEGHLAYLKYHRDLINLQKVQKQV